LWRFRCGVTQCPPLVPRLKSAGLDQIILFAAATLFGSPNFCPVLETMIEEGKREGDAPTSIDSPAALSAATGNAEQTPDGETGSPLKREVSLQDQSSRLPPKELALVTTSLLFSIFLSSFEQTSVSTTLPGIARDFGTSTSISWVGTAFLVTSTSSQVIYSRLSDIFGRKVLLIVTIAIFSLGNLLCGFAKNLGQLIVFRAIAGFGGGGIQVLVLIIMSDIVSLKERGKVK